MDRWSNGTVDQWSNGTQWRLGPPNCEATMNPQIRNDDGGLAGFVLAGSTA